MRCENDVKKLVKKLLNKYNVFWFCPGAGSFGKIGMPDIIAIYNGRFAGIECKFGNRKQTALQQEFEQRVKAAGGVYVVINDECTSEKVLNLLRDLGVRIDDPSDNTVPRPISAIRASMYND